jgi:beta-N-acetylhexosaminidase
MNLSAWSLEQLAGQRLMVGFDGLSLNDQLKQYIDTFKVGGIILFSRNLDSPKQIDYLCRGAQRFAARCGQPPLFIALDQEGGEVARLKEPFTQFPGNPHLKDEGGARQFARTTAYELLSIGINMNMAPVLDVAPSDINSIMARRAFGDDPQWVAKMGVAVVEQLQQSQIISVAKHFPGIGRTTLDSHLDLPRLETTYEQLAAFDLVPFESAMAHNVGGIMLSHIVYPQLDPQWPASLSTPIARDLLRQKLGYHGLVLTDDLDMGAISKYYNIQTAVQQILLAEIDITLICHPGENIGAAFNQIKEDIDASSDPHILAHAPVERILALKKNYIGGNFFD